MKRAVVSTLPRWRSRKGYKHGNKHPRTLSSPFYSVWRNRIFTRDRPIFFAFHAHPTLIHQLTYRRTNHDNIHVRGYKEEGTTTTPFDMVVLNELDRFHRVGDVIDRVPSLGSRAAYIKQVLHDKLLDHKAYIHIYGEDLPEIRSWPGA